MILSSLLFRSSRFPQGCSLEEVFKPSVFFAESSAQESMSLTLHECVYWFHHEISFWARYPILASTSPIRLTVKVHVLLHRPPGLSPPSFPSSCVPSNPHAPPSRGSEQPILFLMWLLSSRTPSSPCFFPKTRRYLPIRVPVSFSPT